MPVRYQLVIDCTDPDLLARFWAAALGYELAPSPTGFSTWNDYYHDLGLPEEELVDGADRISDPDGHGPAIWFHALPDATRTRGSTTTQSGCATPKATSSTSTDSRRGQVNGALSLGTSCARPAGRPG